MLKPSILLALLLPPLCALAGDDASGPIAYKLDLGRSFSSYVITDRDRAWATSLTTRLKYEGEVIFFVRTDLPLEVDGTAVQGLVYHGIEMPEYFYVVPGDAMLKIGTQWPYSPGVGGFSMHAPPSKNFIACLHCNAGGVPFLSSSPVIEGLVSWGGRNYRRF